MTKHKGKCDIFFGSEHRLRKEEMEEQFDKEAKKDGDLQRVQQELLRKQQVASTLLEKFLWPSTATWEQLWEPKKERLIRSQVMKEESPKQR